MTVVQAELHGFDVRLSNKIIAVPCEVIVQNDSVHVSLSTGRVLKFQFVVTGHQVRLVARDMDEDVILSNVLLHDFSIVENQRLQLENTNR